MPKATHSDTTPTPAPGLTRTTPDRRGLLGSAAALIAGGAVDMLPRTLSAAGTGPDAALIALADEIMANNAETNRICEAMAAAELPFHEQHRVREQQVGPLVSHSGSVAIS